MTNHIRRQRALQVNFRHLESLAYSYHYNSKFIFACFSDCNLYFQNPVSATFFLSLFFSHNNAPFPVVSVPKLLDAQRIVTLAVPFVHLSIKTWLRAFLNKMLVNTLCGTAICFWGWAAHWSAPTMEPPKWFILMVFLLPDTHIETWYDSYNKCFSHYSWA